MARRGLGLEPGSLKMPSPGLAVGDVLGRHCLLPSSL